MYSNIKYDPETQTVSFSAKSQMLNTINHYVYDFKNNTLKSTYDLEHNINKPIGQFKPFERILSVDIKMMMAHFDPRFSLHFKRYKRTKSYTYLLVCGYWKRIKLSEYEQMLGSNFSYTTFNPEQVKGNDDSSHWIEYSWQLPEVGKSQ